MKITPRVESMVCGQYLNLRMMEIKDKIKRFDFSSSAPTLSKGCDSDFFYVLKYYLF